MMVNLPSREEAGTILAWASEQNPGKWIEHSQTVARIAETVARAGGLDAHRAYVSGLLHDVGRYVGVVGMRHIYAGYELMKRKGFDTVADICLSHSFAGKNIGEYFGEIDGTREEVDVIVSFLAQKSFDDYDRLIQLSDSMGMAEGVTLVDVRMLDVIRRYGFNDCTLPKLEVIFEIKKYFDGLCKKNIYDLFYEEIREISFRS